MNKDFLEISRRCGRAMGDYEMLRNADRVLIAVSGGKDSLALLHILLYRQKILPFHTTLKAVHVDMSFPGFPVKKLERHFQQLGVDYHIEKIDPFKGKEARGLNCFWCSRSRRKVLFDLAQRFGFNKIAFGHHMDDIVETILLNLFFRGELGAMRPKQDLFDGKLTLIRPLAYEKEERITKLARALKLDKVCPFRCPQENDTQRKMIKRLLARLEKKNPSIKKNIFHSLRNVREEYLLDLPA